MSKPCPGCWYRRPLASVWACHYSLEEGKLRDCSAEDCYRNKVHYLPQMAGRLLRRNAHQVRGGMNSAAVGGN